MGPGVGNRRLAGLDGVRGLAALFVVLNHVFLRAFPGYPVDHAPVWAAGFIYGRFAVVVFIVLSGFCLAAAPARRDWQLGSVRDYARRRAWRILPAYWAALAFSLVMTWFVVAQPGWPVPNARSVVVHALLLQDFAPLPSPNRAFWSIAIEAQLYVLFPLLILCVRRRGALVMFGAVAAPVIALGVVPAAGSFVGQFTPDLAVLFAMGVAAARAIDGSRRDRPWHRYAAVLAVPPLALIGWRGSVWTIDHLFWIDLMIGPAIACLLAALAQGRAHRLARVLDSRPLRSLGSYSYSLYLTHAPIVIALYYGVLRGRVPQGVPTFLVLAAIVVPLTLAFARLFAAVFERPFQRRRERYASSRLPSAAGASAGVASVAIRAPASTASCVASTQSSAGARMSNSS